MRCKLKANNYFILIRKLANKSNLPIKSQILLFGYFFVKRHEFSELNTKIFKKNEKNIFICLFNQIYIDTLIGYCRHEWHHDLFIS